MCSEQALSPLFAQMQSFSYRRALIHRDAAQNYLAGLWACGETRIFATGGLGVLAQARDHPQALEMLLALVVYAYGFTRRGIGPPMAGKAHKGC